MLKHNNISRIRRFTMCIFCTVCLVLASCNDDFETSQLCKLNITTTPKIPSTGIITLSNQTSSHVVSIEIKDTTETSVTIEQGLYNIRINGNSNDDFSFTGLVSDCMLSTSSANISIPIVQTTKSNLIFKELYYTGCKGGNSQNYTKDQYYILYNNSQLPIYLDGLCIAMIAQTRATSTCPWGDFSKYNYSAAYRFVWQFPGEGNDHPLLPGEEIVIAPNCINHIELGNLNSVNLTADNCWAAYSATANLTMQTPPTTNDGKCLNLIWKSGTMTTWSASCFDPAMVIFTAPTSAQEYVTLPQYTTQNPANISDKFDYLIIPHSCILDGVEIFDSDRGNKRLPPSVDAGYAKNTFSIASGTSVIRKVDQKKSETLGMTVYQDTNNSSDDFIVLTTPTLKQ